MSRRHRQLRRVLALTAVGALTACAAGPGSAQAASLTQGYRCLHPIITPQPMTVDVEAPVPASAKRGQVLSDFDIVATASTSAATRDGYKLIGITSISGTVTLAVSVTAPAFPSTLELPVALAIAETPLPTTSAPIILKATGGVPGLLFPQVGAASITVDAISFVLKGKQEDGTFVELHNARGVPESDADPATFDVPCALDPADQATTLASVDVVPFDGPDTPLAAPGRPTASEIAATTAKLCWPAVAGAFSYEVEYEDVRVQVPRGTCTTLTGLAPDSEYYVQVRAKSPTGERSALSENELFVTPHSPGGPPSAPTGLHATVGATTLELSWTASTDDGAVTGYDIFQDGTKVQSVTGTTATIDHLSPGTSYRFVVRARDDGPQSSAPSDPLTVTTRDSDEPPSTPGTPTVASPADVTATTAKISWDASTDDVGLKGYEVRYGDTVVPLGNVTTTTLTKLSPETDYTITVAALDIGGNRSAPSGRLNIHTDVLRDNPPTAPTNVYGTRVTASSIDLWWGPSTDDHAVAGYDVYQGGEKVQTVIGTTATIGGLAANTPYTFKVQARDDAGQTSPFSAGFTVTTKPDNAGNGHLVQTYTCRYPVILPQPLQVDIDAAIPTAWEAGVPTPKFQIDAKATVNTDTASGLGLVGVKTLSGIAYASATVNAPGFPNPLSVTIPLAVPTVTRPDPAAPIVIKTHGETPELIFPEAGTAGITVDSIRLVLTGKDDAGEPVQLANARDVPNSDTDPNTFDVECKLESTSQDRDLIGIDVVLEEETGDPPTAPGVPTIASRDDLTPTSAKISWAPSTDNIGVTGYDILWEDQKVSVPGNVTTATLTGLTPDTEYYVSVVAKDAAGNRSEPSDELFLVTPQVPVVVDGVPTAPTNLNATPAMTSVVLSWTAATDDKGISGYDVYKDGVKLATVTATSFTATGLTPFTAYRFKVQARDTKPQTGPFSTEITVKMLPEPLDRFSYTLKGTSTLKTLTTGKVPLTGAIDARFTLATGAFSADLAINRTKARLTALGVLPITGDILLVPTSKVTGSLIDGRLNATANFKVRLTQLWLFGAVPIAGDGNCQTRQASKALLKSTAEFFSPVQGGQLVGTYAISDLVNCGLMTGFISPLASGGGNTLDINLTPKT